MSQSNQQRKLNKANGFSYSLKPVYNRSINNDRFVNIDKHFTVGYTIQRPGPVMNIPMAVAAITKFGRNSWRAVVIKSRKTKMGFDSRRQAIAWCLANGA